MAAGIGSRLKSITSKKPKCMIKVAGKPILHHQIHAYKQAGIDEIIIVGGYKIDKIINCCEKIKDINIKIVENKSFATTNNMYSLYLAKDKLLGSNFLLSNGDVVFDPEIVVELVENSISSAVVCDKSSKLEKHMKVSINNSGCINDIDINIPTSRGINSVSIFKFSKETSFIFFKEISRIINKNNNLSEWFEIAIQNLLKSKKLIIYPFEIGKNKWAEIDDFEDLAFAERIFSK